MKKKFILVTFLFIYSLSLSYFAQFFSYYRRGYYILHKEKWIIIAACALCIEILNQITYRIARRNKIATVRIKVFFFWLIYTIGMGTYITLLSRLETNNVETDPFYLWWTLLKPFIIAGLIIYSFSVNVRFIGLAGKFKRWSE